MYSLQYMRSASAHRSLVGSDLTARARIRDAAMALFAKHGVAATSLRGVARVAGVSPGLVVHHFGSKDGLVQAVDESALAMINHAVREVPVEEPGGEWMARRAEVVADLLRTQPALCDYLGRALSERTEASANLFHRLFSAAARDEHLVAAGVVRADSDPFWRAMHQVLLVVGPLMLRRLIERELQGELLAEDNVVRWTRAITDLLRNGLYAEPHRKAIRDASRA
jgi:AcrR family transcriptional regulator